MDPRTFRTPEVASLTGLTYRQLDYWTRIGMVRPSVAEAKGSGTWRYFSELDVRVLIALRRLLDNGVSLASVRRAKLVNLLYGLSPTAWATGILVLAGHQAAVTSDAAELIALLGRHGGVCTLADLASTAVPDEREAVPA